MEKSLKYFMREENKKEQIVEVPGPDTYKDEKGNVIMLQVRKLSQQKITEINEMYKSRVLVKDKKGNPLVVNGTAVFRDDKDSNKSARHLMVEALAYPDLRDKELMEFYNEVDVTNMPYHVFRSSAEFTHVSRKIMEVLDMIDPDEEDGKEIDDAKN